MENLKSWIKNNGGYIDSDIELNTDDPNNRFLYVTKNKLKDELLITIPEICLIKGPLLLAVEIDKGKNSFFYPYINLLPKEENLKHLPLYKYTEESLPYINTINQEIYKNLIIYQSEIKNLVQNNNISESLAKYVIAIYHSRSFNNFIPMSDLITHSVFPNALVKGSVLYSFGLNAGDMLTITYSMANSIVKYCNYGFIDDLSHLQFSIDINNLLEPGVLTDYKINTLKKYNLPQQFTACFNKNNIHIDLLTIFRIICMDVVPDNNLNLDFKNVVSMSNEYLTLHNLLNIIKTDCPVGELVDNDNSNFSNILYLTKSRKDMVDICINHIKQLWCFLLKI